MQTRELSPAMDLWAMGCILGEMLQMLKVNQKHPAKRRVLLPGLHSEMTPGQYAHRDPNKVRSQMSITCGLLGKFFFSMPFFLTAKFFSHKKQYFRVLY